MFLRNAENGDLAQVVTLSELTDPNESSVTVQFQAGEEVGDPINVNKSDLTFASGEALPKCWMDAHYRISF